MAGQPEGFEEFVAARGSALLRFAFMLTHDRGRAEDVVQDALVKVHRRWDHIVRVDQPEAYVRRMVTNEFLSWRRRRSSAEQPDELPIEQVADPSVHVDERDAMWRALLQLPDRQRAVLVLRFYEDMTDAQIAVTLGCALGTVSSLAARAIATLRTNPWMSDPSGTERSDAR